MKGVAAAVGVFGLSLLMSAAAGFSRDEAWFLQVVDRVVRGTLSTATCARRRLPLDHRWPRSLVRVPDSRQAITVLAFVEDRL
jgi:hypothetical protein